MQEDGGDIIFKVRLIVYSGVAVASVHVGV